MIRQLHKEIHEEANYIRYLKRRFWYMVIIWLLTVASGLAVFVTGKFPPIEIKLKQPAFGSVYPDNLFE